MRAKRGTLSFVPSEVRPEQSSTGPDGELGHRLVAGDPEVLGEIYDLLSPTIWSMARRALTASAAEDVVQDVLFQVWTRRDQYDADRGKLTPWILRIARNRITDVIRAIQVRPQAGPLDPSIDARLRDDGLASPWEHAWIAEQRRLLRSAIGELATGERDVLWMAYYGYTQTEISSRLGVPLGTVKTRTRAALRKLRDRLAGLGLVD